MSSKINLSKPDLKGLFLHEGNHDSREAGMCAMEAVAWLAGEKHSDSPVCTDLIITMLVQTMNDELSDGARQKLKDYLPCILGTNPTDLKARVAAQLRRAYIALDHAVRVFIPLDLEPYGSPKMKDLVKRLRGLQEIKDPTSAATAAYLLGGANVALHIFDESGLAASVHDVLTAVDHYSHKKIFAEAASLPERMTGTGNLNRNPKRKKALYNLLQALIKVTPPPPLKVPGNEPATCST